MLLVAAFATTLLILIVSFDAFHGRTAVGSRYIYRRQTPGQFWLVLGLYLLGAVMILVAGILSILPEPDCDPTGDGDCAYMLETEAPAA